MGLFPISYAAPVSYFARIVECEKIVFEKFEYFPKQTLRNHCYIATANGVMKLSIPLSNRKNKTQTKDIRINYFENWQKHHWKSMETAYKNSPYFEHYQHKIQPFYQKRFSFLIDLNVELFVTICQLLKVNVPLDFTTEYCTESVGDFRNYDFSKVKLKDYYQVFADKTSFRKGMSILDLLFNEGNQALHFLYINDEQNEIEF